jgi:hypothetical protein
MAFAGMIFAALVTWLVYHHQKDWPRKNRHTAGYLFWRELIADVLLLISVSVFTFIFWEKGIMTLLTARPAASFTDIGFLFLLFSISYILFYLPLRYLFLLEDHTSRQTWQRMLIIFGLLVIRSLFIIMGQ